MLDSIKKSKLMKQIEKTRKLQDQREHLKMQQQLGVISELEYREQIQKLERKEEADNRISLGSLLKQKYLNNEKQKYASIDFNLEHQPYQDPLLPKPGQKDRFKVNSPESGNYGSVATA